MHEIGHALGLGHQGPYNGSSTYGVDNIYTNDTWRWSTMSYHDQDDAAFGDTFDYVLTPQMADIYAVQSIYGAQSTRTGNTTYGFNSNAGSFYNFSTYSGAPAFTYYDTGGIDTLDASGYSNNQTINLAPGSWSSIGGEVNNIGIYLSTTIENAKGGNGQRHHPRQQRRQQPVRRQRQRYAAGSRRQRHPVGRWRQRHPGRRRPATTR